MVDAEPAGLFPVVGMASICVCLPGISSGVDNAVSIASSKNSLYVVAVIVVSVIQIVIGSTWPSRPRASHNFVHSRLLSETH